MYRIQLDPGPWQQYVKRADNIGLPLHEVSKKYMMESNLYATQLFEALQTQQNQSPVAVAAPGSGGASELPPVILSNCIEFIVNTTSDTFFSFTATSLTQEFTYTVEWGDGETEEGSSGEGGASLSHTYPDSDTEYTVRVCFSDASVINNLDFPGFD